jgi:hypothetical protein
MLFIFLYCLQAGINLPIITFSFNSFKLSIFQLTAHSTKTLTVSWKDAADNQLSVYNDIFVIHKSNLSQIDALFQALINLSFSFLNLIISTISHGKKSGESHLSNTLTLLNICLTIISICLEFTVCH